MGIVIDIGVPAENAPALQLKRKDKLSVMTDFIIEFFCEIADFFINLQTDKITEKSTGRKIEGFFNKGEKSK